MAPRGFPLRFATAILLALLYAGRCSLGDAERETSKCGSWGAEAAPARRVIRAHTPVGFTHGHLSPLSSLSLVLFLSTTKLSLLSFFFLCLTSYDCCMLSQLVLPFVGRAS